MNDYRMVKQVRRKPKAFSGVLRKIMIAFAVIFLAFGIMISQGFMLPGFLMVVLYLGYNLFSEKEYEYTLEGDELCIDVIMGKRFRKNAHELDLKKMEVLAPPRHENVSRYRKDAGGEKLPKYDYTSYEENIPYYTMIIVEDQQKVKILLDLEEDMLQTIKRKYPQKVFLQ